MNTIVIEKNHSMDVTVLSNYFLDEYMPKANGEYVKIYLYLLRCCCSNMEVSISSIADLFEYTEKDIVRALTYWEQLGLLSLSYDDLRRIKGITIKEVRVDAPVTFKYVPDKHSEDSFTLSIEDEEDNSIDSSKAISEDAILADKQLSYNAPSIKEKRTFTAKELKEFTSDEEIKQLLYIVQTYLGKTLSPSDTNTILYFYDGLHFGAELIEFLIEYCVLNNHKTLRYIEKVAIDWAENGITSVEEAKEHTNTFASTYYPILNAFGISGRNLAAIEKAMIDKWMNDYGFSMELIVEACNKTITSIAKPSFQYADSILQRWYQNKVGSLDEVKSLDEEHSNAKVSSRTTKTVKAKTTTFNSFPQRSYDYNELERQLLSRK
jgi:DnaD/phage-associated family protein